MKAFRYVSSIPRSQLRKQNIQIKHQKELVPLQKYFKKFVDDQNLKQLSFKKESLCRTPKLERKASIITVASNSSIESIGFTEL